MVALSRGHAAPLRGQRALSFRGFPVQRSRCNATRHGLTAETVVGGLEDAEDYKGSKEPRAAITETRPVRKFRLTI